MSLLDGLNDAMINPVYDSILESDLDTELDFEMAIEAVVDKEIELSDSDIKDILNDDNPDWIGVDMTTKDESVSKITDDAVEDDLKSLESMLDEYLAFESRLVDEDEPSNDPESTESCGTKACEMDDDDDEYDDDDEEYMSLDSLLDSIFDK
jgi:hypothetical protein